ncbi:MAG: MarR family winged helix-turn-helix transcriptional regulator [Promethearchaeota archaeon]
MNENSNHYSSSSNINVNSSKIEEIFKSIDIVAKKFYQLQRPIVRKFRLTIPQYFILEQLEKHGKLQFKNLAEICYSSRSTITSVVDTMEKKGLVIRKANPEDRRSLFVKLTDKGMNLCKSIPANERLMINCCKDFKPEEIEQLSILIKKLLDNLDSL